MLLHPQYIKDTNGNKSLVILPAKEFDTLMQELEELEDIKLYDDAMKNDTGERIPMNEAFKMIEASGVRVGFLNQNTFTKLHFKCNSNDKGLSTRCKRAPAVNLILID